MYQKVIKKSTVFSFNSVPDRVVEDRKALKKTRKSPPSRSILTGHGLMNAKGEVISPSMRSANQYTSLMQVNLPDHYQKVL